LPYIQQRFPRYTSYATAGITDLFPTQELSNALVLQSGWFETSYIENLGNGTFDVKPFPIETQVSPVYGLLVEDFNSDGHLDLMLGGNHFSAEVETARYDAGQGLYLQGDGTGGFVAVPPLQSHVDIPGETRGMILLSRSGNRPDLVLAARNNANVWILGKTVR
jgi:hypothetical protein